MHEGCNKLHHQKKNQVRWRQYNQICAFISGQEQLDMILEDRQAMEQRCQQDHARMEEMFEGMTQRMDRIQQSQDLQADCMVTMCHGFDQMSSVHVQSSLFTGQLSSSLQQMVAWQQQVNTNTALIMMTLQMMSEDLKCCLDRNPKYLSCNEECCC